MLPRVKVERLLFIEINQKNKDNAGRSHLFVRIPPKPKRILPKPNRTDVSNLKVA